MADVRGSVIAVTDASGAVTSKNAYDAYGAPAINNVGRFQYTGQMWMAELKLYHFKARAYHPALGRFMQTDPIGYGDGLNLYQYAGSDPVNARDPSGLCYIEIYFDVYGPDGDHKATGVKVIDLPNDHSACGGRRHWYRHRL